MNTNYLHIIDLLGTFSFAAAGSFAAMEKKLDPFGVLIIAFATAIGGGTIRDILIGELPVAWLTNTKGSLVILLAAAAALFFGSHLKKMNKMLFLCDAVGLGLFTIIGIEKGIAHNLSAGICIMLGTVTGSFGGVLRDVLLNNLPLIFHKEIYAMASVAGGILFFLLLKSGIADDLAYSVGMVTVVIVRILAVHFKWSLPKFYMKNTVR
jgi:uncharacterized membrane protein YeiH